MLINYKKTVTLIFLIFLEIYPLLGYSKTYILLTVDVESFKDGNPKKDIWGEIDGENERYGIQKIIDILNKNQTIGTFYLDVYEIAKFGDEAIKKVAQELYSKGHDLELHTHPGPMYGKYSLSAFSLEKQIEILTKGVELIYDWTGKKVKAHRAGAYAANKDTITALQRLDFYLDSSLSPASGSPLYKEGVIANDVMKFENLIELPITYFTQLKIGSWESKRFLDIESSSLLELKKVLSDFASRDACAVNIMMHSFSMTRYGYPDKRIEDKLEKLLKFINTSPNLQSISTEKFIKLYKDNNLTCKPQPNYVPNTGILLTYLRSWERFFDGWENIITAISPVFFIATVFLIGKVIRRR